MVRSQRTGRDRNVNGDISTNGKPMTSAPKQAPINPMS
jgi:hypothetical protein